MTRRAALLPALLPLVLLAACSDGGAGEDQVVTPPAASVPVGVSPEPSPDLSVSTGAAPSAEPSAVEVTAGPPPAASPSPVAAPAPARTRSTSTGGRTRVSVSSPVVRAETVTIGGSKVATRKERLPVKDRTNGKGKVSGSSFAADVTTTLRSTEPS